MNSRAGSAAGPSGGTRAKAVFLSSALPPSLPRSEPSVPARWSDPQWSWDLALPWSPAPRIDR